MCVQSHVKNFDSTEIARCYQADIARGCRVMTEFRPCQREGRIRARPIASAYACGRRGPPPA